MKRKIIQISQNTNVISLPSDFCKRLNLKKGDELEVEEKNNSLIISSDKSIEDSSIKIDLSFTNPMTTRILGSLYKTGYDLFSITFQSNSEKKEIENVIENEFIGFEIISQSDKKIIAKNISEEKIEEFDNILKRLFHMIKTIGKESVELIENINLKKNSINKIKDKINILIKKDNEVNKLTDFCRRILNKKGYSNFKKTPPLYYIIEQLEKIGDEYRDLLKYVLNEKINLESIDIKTIELFSKTNIFFNMIYDCFYVFSLKKITEIGKTRKNLKEDINHEIKKNIENRGILFFLRDILEKSFDLNGAIMASSL